MSQGRVFSLDAKDGLFGRDYFPILLFAYPTDFFFFLVTLFFSFKTRKDLSDQFASNERGA